MNEQEFQEAIEMLRSKDPMTYEEGYFSLLGNVDEYFEQLVSLMHSESEPRMRGIFIELLGDCTNKKVIPVLKAELSSCHREVRAWAYSQLEQNEHAEANDLAQKYKVEHPNEDWY